MALPSLLLLLLLLPLAVAVEQFTGAQGKLLCGGRAAEKVEVRLIDVDFGLDNDDLMDRTYTNSDGNFTVTGSALEMFFIDAEVLIYHSCDMGSPNDSKLDEVCVVRRLTAPIPMRYVVNHRDNIVPYDIGIVDMDGKGKCVQRMNEALDDVGVTIEKGTRVCEKDSIKDLLLRLYQQMTRTALVKPKHTRRISRLIELLRRYLP